jgi:hypothetical protein
MGESFSADDAVMSFSGGKDLQADTPLILQQFQAQYQQPVNMLFDLSSARVHMVRGRSSGQGSMAQIYGPAKLQLAFLKTYGNVCNIKQNMLNIAIMNSCGQTESGEGVTMSVKSTITLSHVLVNSIAFSGSADNMLINQQVGFMFTSLAASSD